MATNHNTPSLQIKNINLAALTKRLEDHADGIENRAAQPMAADMRLAAAVIKGLVEVIGMTAATANATIARLPDQVTGQ